MDHLDEQTVHRYLHNQLPPAEQARCEAHLRSCGECQNRLLEERSWIALLRMADAPAPPQEGLERLLGKLERVLPGPRRRRRWRQIVAACSLGALAGLSGGLLLRGRSQMDVSPVAQRLALSADVHISIVHQLEALQQLQRDPWLMDHFETARTLDDLIIGQRH